MVLYLGVILTAPFCFVFDKERLLIIHTCGLKETIYYKDIRWIRKGFAIYRSGCPAYKYFEIYYPHQEKFLLKSEVCKTKKVERLLKDYTNLEIEQLQVVEETQEEIRRNIEQKNFASLNDLLEQFPNNEAAAALKYLPRLFGGEEEFEQAYALFDDENARDSLNYLRNIYNSLQQLGLGDKVIIDLGLVNQAEYYTGIIFKGYTYGVGDAVITGVTSPTVTKEEPPSAILL